ATSLTKSLRVMAVINFSYMRISPLNRLVSSKNSTVSSTDCFMATSAKASHREDGLLATAGLYCSFAFPPFRRETMRNISAILTAALLLAVPLSLWPQDAPDGVQTYKDRCAACHGAKGEGLPSVKIPPVKGTSLNAAKVA